MDLFKYSFSSLCINYISGYALFIGEEEMSRVYQRIYNSNKIGRMISASVSANTLHDKKDFELVLKSMGKYINATPKRFALATVTTLLRYEVEAEILEPASVSKLKQIAIEVIMEARAIDIMYYFEGYCSLISKNFRKFTATNNVVCHNI